MSFEIQILGSNAAAPAHGRHHTAQSVRIQNNQYLVDCGEGTQLRMKAFGIKKNRLSHIFISHLHGDHYLGLMGLLSTMHLNGRKQAIDLYGPVGLAEIITIQLKYSNTRLSYPIHFHELASEKSVLIMENEHVTVHTIPLNHRIACNGFLFREKLKPRKMIKEKLLAASLGVAQINRLKAGEDVLDENGQLLYAFTDFTLPPKRSRSYAYCSDTLYDEAILPIIKGVDLLYHEATFLHDMLDRAQQTHHTTCKQAATMAKKAAVGQLILGHFSNRYKELLPLLAEARREFPDTVLGEEGLIFSVQE
ncbi:MAG: ribonuclease Z [Marivirga sp.]